LIGQTASYTLKGYDTYYNPVDASGIQASWSSDNGNVTWTGDGFKAVKSGKSQITAVSGNAKNSTNITVLGGSDLASLSAGISSAPLETGTSVSVPVTATLKNGSVVTVPTQSVKWEITGLKANVKDGVLTVQSVNAGAKVGYATPKYDGFSGTPIVFTTSSEQIWENFEKVSYPISFTGLPAEVKGTAAVVQGIDDHANTKVLKLDYDLTGGVGNKFAYAQINGTAGREIPKDSTKMTIDVLGDSSQNWLRVEFADADGKSVYVDLARQLDFTGWRTLSVDLTSNAIKYPAKLKRLYVVNLEQGQDERMLTGSVSFDNIRFTAPATDGGTGLPSAKVMMTIGQKSMLVNGEKKTIDAAPLLKDNTTYVPIKYILDTFGGSASWNNIAKKITITRDTMVLELTVGKKEFLVNGSKKQADVSPIIVNGRTLIPLRLVSEQLGIMVKWDNKTKSITLES
jgi:hypothetical protein